MYLYKFNIALMHPELSNQQINYDVLQFLSWYAW